MEINQEIKRNELIYRGVIKNPNFWNEIENRPTSAVFKDSKGVSVDRDGQRSIEVITSNFKEQNRYKCIVELEVRTCTDEIGVFIKPDSIPENVYHALIQESQSEIDIKPSKAKKLAKSCKVIEFPI